MKINVLCFRRLQNCMITICCNFNVLLTIVSFLHAESSGQLFDIKHLVNYKLFIIIIFFNMTHDIRI